MDVAQRALIERVSAKAQPVQTRPDGLGWLTTREIADNSEPPCSDSAVKRRMGEHIRDGIAESCLWPKAGGGKMTFYRLKGVE